MFRFSLGLACVGCMHGCADRNELGQAGAKGRDWSQSLSLVNVWTLCVVLVGLQMLIKLYVALESNECNLV